MTYYIKMDLMQYKPIIQYIVSTSQYLLIFFSTIYLMYHTVDTLTIEFIKVFLLNCMPANQTCLKFD